MCLRRWPCGGVWALLERGVWRGKHGVIMLIIRVGGLHQGGPRRSKIRMGPHARHPMLAEPVHLRSGGIANLEAATGRVADL